QIPDGYLRVAHVTGHAHARYDARRIARGADRTRRAVEHRTVRAFAAAKVMALDKTREAAALADADHIDLVLRLELIDQDFIAGLQVARSAVEPELTDELGALDSGFLQVPGGWLIEACRLDKLKQSELDSIVAVGGRRLALHHHAWTRLEQSH